MAALKPPGSFGEYQATLSRQRSAAETDAALAQGAGEEGSLLEPGLLQLRAGVGVLALIGLEVAAMAFGLVYPALRALMDAVVARLDLSPTYSGLLLRGVPGALGAINWALGYACILLWLLSFAEAVLFVASTVAAQSKTTKLMGYAAALGERPLRLLDLGTLVLQGTVVFTAPRMSSGA